ncbi:MAG TPA: type I restriction enzyme HsdR N-terminal domain-containing protein [Flavisolibacter sp.]
MIAVQFPEPQFRMKMENGKQYIFDAIRKTWLLLTEEEWVRQNFVSYLTSTLKYPSTVIALEKEIALNDLKKRFDILVYDRQHQPWMLVECKEPKVALNEDVLQQVLRYNISVPVQYIIITNGSTTVGWKKDGDLQLLKEMPEWE